MKIIDYQVLFATGSDELKQQILAKLNDGWSLLGSVCVYAYGVNTAVAQAVVKYEEQPKADPTPEKQEEPIIIFRGSEVALVKEIISDIRLFGFLSIIDSEIADICLRQIVDDNGYKALPVYDIRFLKILDRCRDGLASPLFYHMEGFDYLTYKIAQVLNEGANAYKQ